MAVLKKKARKRLTKQVRKLVKRHGPEAATAFVTGVIAAVSKKASEDVIRMQKNKKRKPVTLHSSTPAA